MFVGTSETLALAGEMRFLEHIEFTLNNNEHEV